MLQNSSHVTPEQKEMSEQILSEVVFWLSVGQSESCKATLPSVAVVFSFHCDVVRACSSFNERSSINECKQQVRSILNYHITETHFLACGMS